MARKGKSTTKKRAKDGGMLTPRRIRRLATRARWAPTAARRLICYLVGNQQIDSSGDPEAWLELVGCCDQLDYADRSIDLLLDRSAYDHLVVQPGAKATSPKPPRKVPR